MTKIIQKKGVKKEKRKSKTTYLIPPSTYSSFILLNYISPHPHNSKSNFSLNHGFKNLLYLESTSSNKKPPIYGFLPYGETFFHHPTGRFSDGRLIIDFIAQDMGLPFVPPFHGEGNVSRRSFREGVNFAVGGSTALEDSFFAKIGVKIPYANVSLVAQLSWFKEFLTTTCHKPSKCKKFLRTSLVLVGEIGGNDYNHAFLEGKNEEEVGLFIPQVVKAIGVTIEELIKLGVTTLMVPGNFPIGCSAYYLTYFEHYGEKYIRDPNTGCINWLNMFSEYHNSLLQMELERIRQIHTHTTIIYADYYNAAMSIYRSPNKYGFTKGALTACCGGEGPFNVSLTVRCGDSASTTCEDPSKYVSWDGIHLTEAAYKWIARGLVEGPYTSPHLITFKSGGFSDH